jgi:hypothetical protein
MFNLLEDPDLALPKFKKTAGGIRTTESQQKRFKSIRNNESTTIENIIEENSCNILSYF